MEKKKKRDANYRINMDWEGTIIRANTGESVPVMPHREKQDANYRINEDWDHIIIERAADKKPKPLPPKAEPAQSK